MVSFQFDSKDSVNYLKYTIAKEALWHPDIKPSAAHLWKVKLSKDESQPYISEGKWKALNALSSNYLRNPLDTLDYVHRHGASSDGQGFKPIFLKFPAMKF